MLPEHRKQRADDSGAFVKTVLILVLSTEKDWYGRLAETSRATWDAEEVEGVETVFYFGRSTKPDTDKFLFTDIEDEFHNMGRKTLVAFEYALHHRAFDYIFRANASLYVHKPGLLAYCQDKPETNLALGVCAQGKDSLFLWGPAYMLSRDVVQKVVENKELWNHADMDDVAVSDLLHAINVPLDNRGSMASIALSGNGYEFVYYEGGDGGGATMKELSDLPTRLPDQFAFRVKDDSNRDNDVRLMKELHAVFSNV